MKRLMFGVLVVLLGFSFAGGFVGCQDDKSTPPAKEKMGRAYPLSSPEKEKVSPPVGEATPKGENAAEKQQTLSGTVIAIEAELGKVSVQDESGKMYTLSAGKGIDLKSLAAGDKVILKHSDGVIKALKKQG